MKVLSVLIIILFTIMSSGFSQTIQSEFIPVLKLTQVKEGDLIEATIRVWPIENADLTQFNKLEKSVLFNSLYLAQITSLGVSQNNSDVVELNAVFIVKSAKIQPVSSFKYFDSVIEIQLGSLAIIELQDQSQDFYIMDQSLNKPMIWIILLGFIIVLVVLIIFKRKFIKEYLVSFKASSLKNSRKKYNELFKNAEKREDYEHLYEDKDIWMNLLTEKVPAHLDFLKVINQHQFKKEWTSSENEEVKTSFEVIRRSFEK